ncbi:MAG: DNA polymerase III subunit delta' [Gammaproteobacteria bacterium]|nr:DNA polymerase III subunit delta' [Gammaproteobacteria bacterium]MCF6229794.1 DNA polymerase III subunit delta' [Gammaproteobacteria bacterium]
MIQHPYSWQTAQWQRLQQRLAQGTLPHALLLYGAQGMGKLHFSSALVNSLLCEHRTESGAACGVCRGCKLLEVGNHPDFTQLSPEEEGKNIAIDKVRKLSSKLSISSQYDGYKVVLITPAEQLNIASANSLLKTLEEPTPDTILILLCSHIDRLLPTIRSRCQKILFAPPPAAQAATWLEEQVKVDQNIALQLLALAGGAPLRAQQLAESGVIEQRADLLKTLHALARGEMTPVQVAEQEKKIAVADILQWLSGWSMDMIRLHFCSHPTHINSPDLLDSLRPLAQQVDVQRVYRYFDKLIEANRLLQTQVNQPLLLEQMLIGWVRLFAKRRS